MPDWTRGEIREELYSHGHQYLRQEPERGNHFVQRAVEELLSEHDWPFRETSEEFLHGEAIEGLGRIDQVTLEDGSVLEPVKRSSLNDQYGRNGSQIGTPHSYYRWGQEAIYSYPESEDAMVVAHYSLAGWVLDSDGSLAKTAESDEDKPVVPSEYRDVILILARCYAKEDVDNEQMAASLRGRYEERVDDMRATLIHRQVDELQRTRVTEEWA